MTYVSLRAVSNRNIRNLHALPFTTITETSWVVATVWTVPTVTVTVVTK